MATEDVLVRIDRTLDRIDSRLARSDQRWEEEQRRWEERDRRWEELARENRRFMDELLRRSAAMTEAQIAALREFQIEISRRLADQGQQILANTQAVLRLLDERSGPDPAQG